MQLLPNFDWNFWTVLFFLFCLMVFIQVVYVLFIYSRLAFFKDKKDASNLPPLSIIIAARNEADNIYENLPYILDQDYPEYEVLVINHQSIDETKHILQAYQQQYPNLRFTQVEKSPHLRPGKKLPVTLGIKGAKYDHLVFTDADCKPTSRDWLKSMANSFSDKKQLVLGYGPYAKEKSFLNKVIRFDTAWIAINYFSFALSRLPYMGVGRNMAYTKDLFFSVDGFKSHYSLASGDDDLFIQEAAKKKNFTITIDRNTHMYSPPEKTWSSWVRQKSRHYTTSSRYQVIKKLLLGIYPLSLLIMYISFVTLLLDKDFRWITLIIFGVALLLKWVIQGRCFYKLNEKSFIPLLPIADLAYSILMPIVYYSSETKTTNRW